MDAGLSGKGMDVIRGLAARPLLVSSLEDHVSQGALIVLCGEPGMGKDEALDLARVVGKQFGAFTQCVDLAGLDPSKACGRMSRLPRSIGARLNAGEWAVVCVRGVPALDEHGVFRMRGIIDRLREAGCCMVLSLRPEAIQLAEGMPDAFYVWPEDLCVASQERLGAQVAGEIAELTAQVPCLVNALSVSERNGSRDVRIGREYHDALCRVITLCLRDSLIDEERQLRLAMLLLGKGTFAQLKTIFRTLDPELIQDICRYVPLLGVDIAQSTFSCAGLCRDEWLKACVFALRDCCSKDRELCAKVAGVLLDAKNYVRAATVLELAGVCEAGVELSLRFATELVNVGRDDIVKRALPVAAHTGSCAPQLRHACQTLIKLIDNAPLEAADIELEYASVTMKDEREEVLRVMALLAARLAWQGRATKLPTEAVELTDALARDLVLHLSATHALVEGRGHAAYHLLVCGQQLTGRDSLAGQLLEEDLALAHVLMGLPCPSSPEEKGRLDMHGACMLCYLPAIHTLDGVWRRGDGTCALAGLDVRAAQAGDELVQVHFLLAAALANARQGAVSHAVVKCNRAHAIAERLGSAFLTDVARIVCWAARINSGDLPPEDEFTGIEDMGNAAQPLARVLACVAKGADKPDPSLQEAVLDPDIAWLAAALLSGLTRLSPMLERVVPPTWLVVIESMRAREEDEVALPELPSGELPQQPEHSIYVRLLGGLEVFVNGERLPAGALTRRRAQSLVAYACSSTARSMRRADVIDALWPECDYDRGAKRIYAATNVINHAVRSLDPECRFFAARGSDHAMSLDTACVHSDVTEFEELARRALESEGKDDEVLSLVRSVQLIYRGDLYVPPCDAGRVVDRRRIDLRNLYADVLVAGAEAAFRRGSLRLSIRLSEQALLADETREDANTCLVKALTSCGRSIEARERSKAFAARMGILRRERTNREPAVLHYKRTGNAG